MGATTLEHSRLAGNVHTALNNTLLCERAETRAVLDKNGGLSVEALMNPVAIVDVLSDSTEGCDRGKTALQRVVREHLETILAQTRETYERLLPRYVVAELRAYLRCGVFASQVDRAAFLNDNFECAFSLTRQGARQRRHSSQRDVVVTDV